MSPVRVVVLILVVGGAAFLAWHVGSGPSLSGRLEGGEEEVPLPVVERPLALTRSEQCRECHPEVYAEWEASHHRMAYTNPEVWKTSEGYKNRDCLPCHLPRPVWSTGLGVRVLERETRHKEGVDCFTCHQAGNASLGRGPISDPGAPCNPRAHPGITSMALCAPCHNQHKVHEDWRQSRFAVPGGDYRDCNDCHMPRVTRRGGAGAEAREGRNHLYAGAHDPEMLRSAATVRTESGGPGKKLLITVKNTGTGHNFPADERHRAVDLDLELSDAQGRSARLRVDRYRNPYRHEFEIKNPLREPGAERNYVLEAGALGEVEIHAVRVPAEFNPIREVYYPESTQIPAGEARYYTITLPEGVSRATVRMYYRKQPFLSDEESVQVHESTIEY